ncbi:MAG: hypothetical protein Q7U41_01805 [Microbacterium sp.]|nr:hypothetical protein [Microbacterium sp.]
MNDTGGRAKQGAVAWVESPLQLLNAVEYGATGVRLDVLPRQGVRQLERTVEVIRDRLPEGVRILQPVRSAADRRFRTAAHRVIGDAFSGQFRLLLVRAPRPGLTVVDDGSLTLHLASALIEGPFGRMAQRESAGMRLLGRAASARLRAAAARGAVGVFTVYADAPEVRRLDRAGFRVVRNEYTWLRALPPVADLPGRPTVVLGSALVTDAQIGLADYTAWLTALARQAPIEYLPHRRESDEQLAAIGSIPGVRVARTDLPAELVLASASAVRRVLTFPSSAVATLGAILPAGRVEVVSVPEHWWLPSADPALRRAFAAMAPAAGASWQRPHDESAARGEGEVR